MLVEPVEREALADERVFDLAMQCGGGGPSSCSNCTCSGNCSYSSQDVIDAYRD